MKRLAVLCSLLLLTACPNPQPAVTITYHQVGACNGFQTPYGLASAGTNQAYVIFGIEHIDNSQRSSTFAFDPTKLFVNSSTRDFFNPGLQLYTYILGPFAAVASTVAAGQNLGFNPSAYGGLVVQTANANGAVEANTTSYFLNYNSQSSDPPVLLTKSNAQQTSWPLTEDCHTISLH